MCLFPKKAKHNKYNIQYYKCGSCPECLAGKAKYWALRSYYETLSSSSCCMVTLTYNDFCIKHGRVVGETEPSTAVVDKRDCQLFIKRLRKHFKNQKIKYILTAEYGKRTHRPHYHAILFGVDFSDKVYYKRSKRGNIIYRSETLTNLWKNGICTIDSVNVTPAVVRYCTKYCVKDAGNNDTFMLFSHGIGLDKMLEHFNGRSYIIDGKEYAIPRVVWQEYISRKYADCGIPFSYKYKSWQVCKSVEEFNYYKDLNVIYRRLRNQDSVYRDYLDYWRVKLLEVDYVPVFNRLLALDDKKYFHYKQKAIEYYHLASKCDFYIGCPRSEQREYTRTLYRCADKLRFLLCPVWAWEWPFKKFAAASCHIAANDTKEHKFDKLLKSDVKIELDFRKLSDFTTAEWKFYYENQFFSENWLI